MNNTIYNLTPEEYQELLDSGMAEKILVNYPKNVSIFKTEKNKYIANQTVFELVLNISDGTGANPSDLYDFFEENYERIQGELDWFGTNLLEKDVILYRLDEEID